MDQLGQEDPKSTQRLLWATVVMAVIFGLWAWLMAPTRQAAGAPEKAPAQAQGAAAKPGEAKPSPPASVEAAAPAPAQEAVSAPEEVTVTIENKELKLILSNRGAVLDRAELKEYREKSDAQENDDLVSPLSRAIRTLPLSLETEDAAYDAQVNGALFHVEQTKAPDGASAVVFTWSDGKGNAVRKELTLPATGYEAGLKVSAVKAGKAVTPVPLLWGPGFGRLSATQAKNRYYQQEYVGLVEGGAFEKVQRLRVKEGKPKEAGTWGEKGPISWAAITNNYFAAIFLPASPMPSVKVITALLTPEEKKVHPADSDISLVVAYPGEGKLFLGPKEWRRLSGMGDSFYRLLDWGSSSFGNAILHPLSAGLLWGLNHLHRWVGNYGIAIILLTFLIRLAFYPLTQRSMVKMKEMGEAMKKLKPQIDRIKAKYKKIGRDMQSRSKMNEEMMALYQKEGINPLGGMSGCLPMLLQMPIFFALFTMLPRAIELRGAPFFGWIHDLSMPDPFYILPLLMGASMVFSTLMTSPQGMEGAQKMMLWFMPIFFTYICLWAPAGLTLYWLVNNLLTMGQQGIINRQVAQRKEEAARGRKSTPKGPSRPSR
jgi:YidC/Oxa1 family membrane protein insertase